MSKPKTRESGYKDKETLEYLYHDEGMSLSQIGDIFDVGPSTVHYHMEKHGVNRLSPEEGTKKHLRNDYATYYINNHGHEIWKVKQNGNQYSVSVHRLMAVAEYGFENVAGNDIHHKNNIPWDNRMENIEPLPHSVHMKSHNGGESNPSAKLAKDEVKDIKRLLQSKSATEISSDYGVTRACIRRIEKGETWKNVEPSNTLERFS